MGDNLFMEIGQTFCSVALVNSSSKSAQFIGMYAFDAVSLDDSMDEILKIASIDRGNLQNIIISPGFPEAILIPNKFYHHKSSLLSSLYDVNHYFLLNDPISECQCFKN